jgi:hypothetical protein
MTDGHCATDSETVYVQNSAGCSTTATGGTAAMPFCAAATGVGSATATTGKDLVVVTGTLATGSATITATAPLSIVGKSNAIIVPAALNPGVTITAGEIYLRNLTVQGSSSLATGIGIKAAPDAGSTVTLHMDTCAVKSNPGGGILLNGAAFDIKNTTVSNNGSGTTGGGTRWGGIRVDSLPTAGSTTLSFVSIQSNGQVGLSCAASITTSNSVLATGNVNGSTNPDDQISGCGITPCTPASTTCGEQSAPQ